MAGAPGSGRSADAPPASPGSRRRRGRPRRSRRGRRRRRARPAAPRQWGRQWGSAAERAVWWRACGLDGQEVRRSSPLTLTLVSRILVDAHPPRRPRRTTGRPSRPDPMSMAPRTRALLLALMTLSCTSGAGGSATPAPMPATGLAEGLRIAERWRAPGLDDRRFDQETFLASIRPVLDGGALRAEEVARSIEGRPIRAISFGEGPTTVLLWSQMHGDESTATMALADIMRFLDGAEDDPLRERLRRSLTVTFVPMLNPDGAERFRRENALGVDVNRDARRLATPEARALKGLRDRIRPDFGFNLHDQGARTVAGSGGEQVAIALLAPAADADRSYGEVRSRARLLAAGIAAALATEIPGRVAKYDDTFNPRAFGDLMQQWGTSTVLIES